MGGVLAGLAVLAWRGAGVAAAGRVVVGACLALGVLGLADDLVRLSPRLRFAVQLAVAAGVVALLGGLDRLPLPPPADLALPGPVGGGLAVLWLVAVTNFYNFMDGIDELAGGQALCTSVALAIVGGSPDALSAATLVAVSLLVFLLFNWAPARVFLGDVGSGFVGFFLAAAPWLGSRETRAANVALVGVSLFLFLADPLRTLAVRWRRGARLTESHRDHLYQALAPRGDGHGQAAALLLATAALLTALAVLGRAGSAAGWLALAVACAAFLGELLLARRVGRARERGR
jgi:Fuc2NAc and GlcNAc transferase